MSAKPVVIVISDLHLGGGNADPGDDHVFDQQQLASFIDTLRTSDDGLAGRIELYINGDFLEFAQVGQHLYTLRSADAWCSTASRTSSASAPI
jgi:UDP-2,3-diacylglucosamine pyrophosphatase LpxH